MKGISIMKSIKKRYGAEKTQRAIASDSDQLDQNSQNMTAIAVGGTFDGSTGFIDSGIQLTDEYFPQHQFYLVTKSGNYVLNEISSWKAGDVFFNSRGKIHVLQLSKLIVPVDVQVEALRDDYNLFKSQVVNLFSTMFSVVLTS